MNFIHSALDKLRDLTPTTSTSTFRQTGQITPEEFLQAGDFLVYKFPSWSWSDATTPAQRVSYLPPDKQYLVTRGVPCHRRLNDNFAGHQGLDDLVKEGEAFNPSGEDDDEGWLRTGGDPFKPEARTSDIRTVDDAGEVGDSIGDEDDIPDIEDEEDDPDAIIRDPKANSDSNSVRTYTIYITYTPYYRTPRLYLSGYDASDHPLKPLSMMEDIVGDYKDKTVTLEDFSFVSPTIKTASIHPCRHASVMKVLLDRADAALKLRTQKMKRGIHVADQGMEGLVDQTNQLNINKADDKKDGADEWEVLSDDAKDDEDDVAIRVDQYLVVFLKFMASVTPGIEHDFTMGV